MKLVNVARTSDVALDVVGRLEKICGKRFTLDHIPEETLRSQFEQAADSMQKSIAALMLGYLYGDAIKMAPTAEKFGLRLTSVDEYARGAVGKTATV
jgi:hypothetical protein